MPTSKNVLQNANRKFWNNLNIKFIQTLMSSNKFINLINWNSNVLRCMKNKQIINLEAVNLIKVNCNN